MKNTQSTRKGEQAMEKQITFRELKEIFMLDEKASNNDFANEIACILIHLGDAIKANPNASDIDKNYNDRYVYHKRMKLYDKLKELGYFDDLRK